MKLTIHRWARVNRDLAEHYAFIAADKVDPAERLLSVAEAAFERLAEFPEMGTIFKTSRRHLQGIRLYPMPAPFRSYLVCYRIAGKRLEVIAVVHGARDLENWLDVIVD